MGMLRPNREEPSFYPLLLVSTSVLVTILAIN